MLASYPGERWLSNFQLLRRLMLLVKFRDDFAVVNLRRLDLLFD